MSLNPSTLGESAPVADDQVPASPAESPVAHMGVSVTAMSLSTVKSATNPAEAPDVATARKPEFYFLLYTDVLSTAYFWLYVLTALSIPSTAIISSLTEKPRYHVQSIDRSYSVYGVDAIWHNQYLGPNSDFIGMRKQYDCDVNQLLLKVAKHVEVGLYFIITMSASPHSLTVVCGCERMQKDMPGDMWDHPTSEKTE